jgi:hypothetical protein
MKVSFFESEAIESILGISKVKVMFNGNQMAQLTDNGMGQINL